MSQTNHTNHWKPLWLLHHLHFLKRVCYRLLSRRVALNVPSHNIIHSINTHQQNINDNPWTQQLPVIAHQHTAVKHNAVLFMANRKSDNNSFSQKTDRHAKWSWKTHAQLLFSLTCCSTDTTAEAILG